MTETIEYPTALEITVADLPKTTRQFMDRIANDALSLSINTSAIIEVSHLENGQIVIHRETILRGITEDEFVDKIYRLAKLCNRLWLLAFYSADCTKDGWLRVTGLAGQFASCVRFKAGEIAEGNDPEQSIANALLVETTNFFRMRHGFRASGVPFYEYFRDDTTDLMGIFNECEEPAIASFMVAYKLDGQRKSVIIHIGPDDAGLTDGQVLSEELWSAYIANCIKKIDAAVPPGAAVYAIGSIETYSNDVDGDPDMIVSLALPQGEYSAIAPLESLYDMDKWRKDENTRTAAGDVYAEMIRRPEFREALKAAFPN